MTHATPPERVERLEMLLAVAGQAIGECPAWVLLALEAGFVPPVPPAAPEAKDRREPC
jgi:hypothetical protein